MTTSKQPLVTTLDISQQAGLSVEPLVEWVDSGLIYPAVFCEEGAAHRWAPNQVTILLWAIVMRRAGYSGHSIRRTIFRLARMPEAEAEWWLKVSAAAEVAADLIRQEGGISELHGV